jgi:hypothetical protein
MTDEPDWFQKYVDLAEAVRDLYAVAHRSARMAADEAALWEVARQAAGIAPPHRDPQIDAMEAQFRAVFGPR